MSKEFVSVKLESQSVKDTDTHAIFNGVVATDSVARNRGIKFSDRALRSMARKINSGNDVRVQVEHNQDFSVGKPLSGKFNYGSNQVESTFDIQKGLEIQRSGFTSSGYATTDDYIKSIRAGTLSDISAGVEVQRMECSYCKEEMKPETIFGFLLGFSDKNGHRPNTTIYVDKNGKESKEKKSGSRKIDILGVMDKVDIFEFSLVNRGAIPGSEIISKIENAYKNGKLTDDQIQLLVNRYPITFSDEGIKLNNPSGENTMDNIEVLQQQIKDQSVLIEKMTATQNAADDQVSELDAKVQDLEDENTDLRSSIQNSDEQLKQIEELQEEINNYKQNSHKIALYDNLVDKATAEAVFQWGRSESAKGRKVDEAGKENQAKEYKRIGNYETILTHADQDRRYANNAARSNANRSDGTEESKKLDSDRLS